MKNQERENYVLFQNYWKIYVLDLLKHVQRYDSEAFSMRIQIVKQGKGSI